MDVAEPTYGPTPACTLRVDYGELAGLLAGRQIDNLVRYLRDGRNQSQEFLRRRAEVADELAKHFFQHGHERCLYRAIELLSDATPAHDSPIGTAEKLNLQLGMTKAQAGRQLRRSELLTDAISILSPIMESATVDPALSACAFQYVSFAYGARAQMTAQADDWLNAVRCMLRLSDRLSPDDPNLRDSRHRAANYLLEHFDLTGDRDSLERSISLSRKCVGGAPQHRQDDASINYILGRALRFRGALDRSSDGLDEAIAALSNAVISADFTAADICPYLSNLGTAHFERYQLTEDIGDLDNAANFFARALAASPSGSSELGRILNLMNCVAVRIQNGGYHEELPNSIALIETRLTKSDKSDYLGAFLMHLAVSAWTKAYSAAATVNHLLTLLLLRRALVHISADVAALDLDLLGLDANRYDLQRIKKVLRQIGVDTTAQDTYPDVIYLIIADITSDLRDAGLSKAEASNWRLEERYEVALFVHADSLEDARV